MRAIAAAHSHTGDAANGLQEGQRKPQQIGHAPQLAGNVLAEDEPAGQHDAQQRAEEAGVDGRLEAAGADEPDHGL